MQTLGLSSSPPRAEGRLKALLWPTIRNDGDFDYITEQGLWICFIVAIFTLGSSIFAHSYLAGFFEAMFYFLAGIGVRQRNTTAALTAFAAQVLTALLLQRYTGHGFGMVRIVFLALLLSNIRGIWLSSRWKRAGYEEQEPIRLNESIFDKLSDQLPPRIWPKARWVFGFFAAIEIGLLAIGLFAPLPPSLP